MHKTEQVIRSAGSYCEEARSAVARWTKLGEKTQYVCTNLLLDLAAHSTHLRQKHFNFVAEFLFQLHQVCGRNTLVRPR